MTSKTSPLILLVALLIFLVALRIFVIVLGLISIKLDAFMLRVATIEKPWKIGELASASIEKVGWEMITIWLLALWVTLRWQRALLKIKYHLHLPKEGEKSRIISMYTTLILLAPSLGYLFCLCLQKWQRSMPSATYPPTFFLLLLEVLPSVKEKNATSL